MNDWKNISGYEGIYEVSTEGVIRSLDRMMPTSRGCLLPRKGTILKPRLNRTGYGIVALNKSGKIQYELVSRIVARTFLKPDANRPQVNHIDGDKLNNAASNLEWTTAKENCQHRDATGLRVAAKGSHHGSAKLTEEIVYRILNEMQHMSGVDVGRIFNVTKDTISLIRRRKIWKHVSVIARAVC